MSAFWEGVVTLFLMVATVGLVAVVVSRKAQTPAVIQSFGSAFSNALGVAESPVTGATYSINLSYPGQDFSGSFGTA